MAKQNGTPMLKKMLLACLTEPAPRYALLVWLSNTLMKLEAEHTGGASKGTHSPARTIHFSGP